MGFPLDRGSIEDGIRPATGTTRGSILRVAAPLISGRMAAQRDIAKAEARCGWGEWKNSARFRQFFSVLVSRNVPWHQALLAPFDLSGPF
jgi:hypothetical protein